MQARRLGGVAAVLATVAAAAIATVPAGGASAPRIRSVHMSVKVFAVGDWNTPLTVARRTPRGTRVRVTLNKAATIIYVVQRLARGRVVGGTCVRATHRNRHNRRCQRKLERMRLTREGHAGKNPLRFSGRSDGKVLNPGPFQFAIHAVRDGLRSETRTLRFRIVRG